LHKEKIAKSLVMALFFCQISKITVGILWVLCYNMGVGGVKHETYDIQIQKRTVTLCD
jgi:hypothetical protein